MDEWGDLLFEASYSGFPIDIVSTEDDISQTLIRHEFPFRDGAVLQDTGKVPRSTSGTVVFVPVTGQTDNHRNRAIRFLNILGTASSITPTPQFVHPLFGAYPALPESVSVSANADDRNLIAIDVTFVEAGLDPAAFQTTTDQSVESGAAAVSGASMAVTASVDQANATASPADKIDPLPTVQTDATEIADGWVNNESLTPRQVNLELNKITNEISDETTRLELAMRVDRYPIFLSFLRLHATMRRAADLAIATGPALQDFEVKRTEPLLALMTDLYGGDAALDQYNRTRELNDISNPSRIEAGTKLVIEQP